MVTVMTGMMLLIPQLHATRHVSSWPILRELSPVIYCIAGILLAGAGINTQTAYRAVTGFHRSMFFTLSLPISRKRLFSVRAGLGAIETCVFVVIVAVWMLCSAPGPLSALQVIEFVMRVVICTLAVYALFAFLATFLDDMWRINAGIFGLLAAWMLQSRFPYAAGFNPLAGISLFPYPLTAAMPWPPVITSGAAIAVFTWSSFLVLQRKEF